jgi:hypothetical protein
MGIGAMQNSDTEAITQLKAQIRVLTHQQVTTLKRATFLGMSAAQAKAYDERLQSIAELQRKLAILLQGIAP